MQLMSAQVNYDCRLQHLYLKFNLQEKPMQTELSAIDPKGLPHAEQYLGWLTSDNEPDLGLDCVFQIVFF